MHHEQNPIEKVVIGSEQFLFTPTSSSSVRVLYSPTETQKNAASTLADGVRLNIKHTLAYVENLKRY